MYSLSISFSEAKRIARLDSQGEVGFVKDNAPQVLNLVNTWLCIILDSGVPLSVATTIRDSLVGNGLIANIEACEDVTQVLMEGFISGTPYLDCDCVLSAHFTQDRSLRFAFAQLVDSIRLVETDPDTRVRKVLQCLQFPVRFTYISSGGAEKAFEKYFIVNGRCRLHGSDWSTLPGEAIQDGLREELAELFRAECWEWKPEDVGFSNGSLAGGIRFTDEKWKELSRFVPCYHGFLEYPLPGGRNDRRPWSIPTLMAVPKKFNSRRIIAPENALVNYYGKAALGAIRRMLARTGNDVYINEEDQTVNRNYAFQGSLAGDWCTIDMSSASDSISRYIFFRCIPESFRPMYLNFMSWYVKYTAHGKELMRPLHSLLTSGNPITWITESIWFLALGRLGCRLAGLPGWRTCVYSFGDDMIVPREAYETVMDVLECFGHTVNRRKSFGSGLFRESCGGWFYHGADVTPNYWPRRTVSAVQLSSVLAQLQHKLVSLPLANSYLCDTVRKLEPQMTFSPVGTDGDDLWDAELNPYLLDMGQHWRSSLVTRSKVKLSSLTQHVAYYEYLHYGPMYVSALDEELGISSSRLDALLTHSVSK